MQPGIARAATSLSNVCVRNPCGVVAVSLAPQGQSQSDWYECGYKRKVHDVLGLLPGLISLKFFVHVAMLGTSHRAKHGAGMSISSCAQPGHGRTTHVARAHFRSNLFEIPPGRHGCGDSIRFVFGLAPSQKLNKKTIHEQVPVS